jgi:hypothetical protein
LRHPVVSGLKDPPGRGVAQALDLPDDVEQVGALARRGHPGHVFHQYGRRGQFGYGAQELGHAIAGIFSG